MEMAVLVCSHCNERIAEEAVACRYCGSIVSKQSGAPPGDAAADAQPASSKARFTIVAAVLLVLIVAFIVYRTSG